MQFHFWDGEGEEECSGWYVAEEGSGEEYLEHWRSLGRLPLPDSCGVVDTGDCGGVVQARALEGALLKAWAAAPEALTQELAKGLAKAAGAEALERLVALRPRLSLTIQAAQREMESEIECDIERKVCVKRPRAEDAATVDDGAGSCPVKSHASTICKESRENLVNQWREVSKPKRQGAVAAKPRGAKVDFPDLFEHWLEVRGLRDALERVDDERGWLVYRYKRLPVVEPSDSWEVAYHGTWWYSIWSILESGVMLESNDMAAGHDFWEPGVYVSPMLETARWYARPHQLFGDGVYHRVILDLLVDPERRKRSRQRGGVQWVFDCPAVALRGLRVQVNAPPANGEERVNEWDPQLEALPPYCDRPEPTVNPRQGPWPEVDGEQEDAEEQWPLAPYLMSAANGSARLSAPGQDFDSQPLAKVPKYDSQYYEQLFGSDKANGASIWCDGRNAASAGSAESATGVTGDGERARIRPRGSVALAGMRLPEASPSPAPKTAPSLQPLAPLKSKAPSPVVIMPHRATSPVVILPRKAPSPVAIMPLRPIRPPSRVTA